MKQNKETLKVQILVKVGETLDAALEAACQKEKQKTGLDVSRSEVIRRIVQRELIG